MSEYRTTKGDQIPALFENAGSPNQFRLGASMELSNIRRLLPEFKTTFLATPKGQEHMSWFPSGRAIGRNNLAEAIRRADAGEEVTDFVLSKLLPHLDSPHNRERGAWCCIAPAVTRDIRQWFEGIGWVKSEDWPKIARLLLEFIKTVTSHPDRLAAECEAFRSSPYSKGFQSGFLSPILNAVRPLDFAIVNSKTKKTLKRLADVTCKTRLVDYPTSNLLVRSVVTQLNAELLDAGGDVLPGDVFDAFCHWWVAVYRGEVDESIDEDIENADWTKQTWDLPPYKSKEFLAIFTDLEAFRKLPVYRHAVRNGLIVDDQWVGAATTMNESELCLIGTAKSLKDWLPQAENMIHEKGAVAIWWSFRLRDEATTLLRAPFYLYLNTGGGQFPVRARVDDYASSPLPSGMRSPWADITFPDERDKTRDGEEQSRVFRTWFRVSTLEPLQPPANLSHFSPVPGLSTATNLLNQNAFGYAYADVARMRERQFSEPRATFDPSSSAWLQRSGVEKRVRKSLEESVPNEETRLAALRFLAFAIENADEERPDSWHLRETKEGLQLITGRRPACEIERSKMRVAVIGPISDEVRGVLGANAEDDVEHKRIPGSLSLTFSIEHIDRALELLKEPFSSFVDLAMARVRKAVSLEDHSPEAVTYIAKAVGRDLPQPVPASEEKDSGIDREADDEAAVSKEPRVRGRAPIFEYAQRSIASLMSDIEGASIALPDLQRAFVWEDTKVRDLLDSLFVGFPVGTLVFWHTSRGKDVRAIGTERPGLIAQSLVIDGQQRLTSLYAVMRGVKVVDKDGDMRAISIAFRPRDGRFEVADAAIRNDPEFLPNVTELWTGTRLKSQIRRELMQTLRDKGRSVNETYEDAVERNLERAQAIADYRFPTVDIRKTATTQEEEATEEDVAEIFVRINNQGMRLGQVDFVLTLLSVYHGELRDRIEESARAMSEGAVAEIDAQQLLRAVCAVAFGRARMSAVYRFLRGVDPNTGEADAATRQKRISQLDYAAKECIELTPWRDYLLRVRHAGFVSESLIASKNAIVNAYAFYIRGRNASVAKNKLDAVIARWVFGTLLTARYSGASETVFEQDLARIEGLRAGDAEGFVTKLDEALGEIITGDYWTHTVVSTLETRKARAPTALAFRAAQVILGTRALFSDQLLQNLFDSSVQGRRAASEAHHLFPVAWLYTRGIRDRRVNQVANFADVGWYDNSIIGAQGPAQYVPRIREALSIDDDRWGRMCAEHALPLGWELMNYDDFLRERRQRMAELIRVAFRQLGGEADAAPLTPPWFLPGAEAVWQRIVQIERALRGAVRDVYVARFGESAPTRIQEALPEGEREVLARALRSRPAGADTLSIVDYLYIKQLPVLLFRSEVQEEARRRLGLSQDAKRRLLAALDLVAPVRNEIAHVREISSDRLLRASVACADVLDVLETRN